MTFFLILLLLILSAMFSGLTIGYFSLAKDDLERKAEMGDKKAIYVFAVRKNGNLLLCTLLLGNVGVNVVLSIFLGSITNGVFASVLATLLIVSFGEILPQATFSRHALNLGAKFSPLIKILIYLLYPIAWPIAWGLDQILGEELPTIYSKKELIKLIEDHEDSPKSEIDADEEKILKGALSYSDKKVKDIMTSIDAMFTLAGKEKLTKTIINKIIKSGHSRIPIYKKDINDIIGILYAKDLINEKTREKEIKNVAHKKVIFINQNEKLDKLLNKFKKKRNHLFVVINKTASVVGLVSIEDVLEEIIGDEIVDEFDKNEKDPINN